MITNLKQVEVKKLTKREIEQKLLEYKEIESTAKAAQKQLTEWKDFLRENLAPGVYGSMMMMIEKTDVKEYVVKASVRSTLKVEKIK